MICQRCQREYHLSKIEVRLYSVSYCTDCMQVFERQRQRVNPETGKRLGKVAIVAVDSGKHHNGTRM